MQSALKVATKPEQPGPCPDTVRGSLQVTQLSLQSPIAIREWC